MEKFNCAVIGAGAAGLNASLVLGRSHKKVVLFDNQQNRNRVTHESHGFLTRDGIAPGTFKQLALEDVLKYPSVMYKEQTVTQITRQDAHYFKVETTEDAFLAETILIATGVQEEFPVIDHIYSYFGKSLFSCPFCDGWENSHQPLVLIVEDEAHALMKGKLIRNWTNDLLIATNGQEFSIETVNTLTTHGIEVITEPIEQLIGENGQLQAIQFVSGQQIERAGGFVDTKFIRKNDFAEKLECEMNELGKIVADESGRTSQKGVYVAGETAKIEPSSLIMAAAEGYKSAIAIVLDQTNN
ncbi:NAD(P)/FAD-dependent oxidoreductase [Priestia flexa]|uniref:NAD(P)/FAD-dependent oxidoreductase n=1 Tax=Priestia flexa TaxID=86664 RepID=UPI00209D2807|nr:NAD(P)/FAD-dependent oxidoreductase [Priestia flexa]MCP1191483.1 NAD(P)/FAD-dependent oxidoreductase [Priestia flexa]